MTVESVHGADTANNGSILPFIEATIMWLSEFYGSPILITHQVSDLINPQTLFQLCKFFLNEEDLHVFEPTTYNEVSSILDEMHGTKECGVDFVFNTRFAIDCTFGDENSLIVPFGLMDQVTYIEKIFNKHIKLNQDLDIYNLGFGFQLNWLKIILFSDLVEISKFCKMLMRISSVSPKSRSICKTILHDKENAYSKILRSHMDDDSLFAFSINPGIISRGGNSFHLKEMKLARKEQLVDYVDEDYLNALKWENSIYERTIYNLIIK